MLIRILSCMALLLCTTPLSAHEATDIAGGFSSGFMHPILGWDHVAAMVAVGLWGAILKNPALWILPITFPLIMAVGGALGLAGIPLAGVEIGIAVSALVLGVAVLTALRPALWLAAIVVGCFAIFHGHAHGSELPQAANPLAYSLGFVIATGLLHLAGIALGLLTKWQLGQALVRAGGAIIAIAGAWFLIQAW